MQYRKAFIIERDDSNNETYRKRNRRIYEFVPVITQLATGSGWKRYFVGYGSGDVRIQVEGELRDMTDGKVICSFATVGDSWGNAHGGWNVKVFSEAYCMKRAMDPLVKQLIKNLQPFF